MRLDAELVEELARRANDPMQIDQDTVGWRKIISTAAEQSGPHWFNITFDRQIAREDGAQIFITPHHPIVRLLCDEKELETLHLVINRPLEIPPEAKWCVCIDWTVNSLSKTTIRRWLYLTKEGMPLAEENGESLRLLCEGLPTKKFLISSLLEPIEESLLDTEKRRLLPLLDELRANAEQAWHRRITREMGQLADADWTARAEGKMPDPRWVRMKNSLITKLQDELAKRLNELDQIRHDLKGRLDLRVAIQLE